jgi:hypothetical protein
MADYEESLRLLSRDRRTMAAELGHVPGLTIFPSQGNFILVKLPTDWSGVGMRDYLVSKHGIYTRECVNKLGMTSQFMRLVVRPAADVDRLIDGMEDYSRQVRSESSYGPSSAAYPTSPGPYATSPSYPTSPGPYATGPSNPTTPTSHVSSASYSSGRSYAKNEPAPVETGYNRRWNLEDERDNVTSYSTRRASGY